MSFWLLVLSLFAVTDATPLDTRPVSTSRHLLQDPNKSVNDASDEYAAVRQEVTKLVQAWCQKQNTLPCEVDTSGDTVWYKQNLFYYPSLSFREDILPIDEKTMKVQVDNSTVNPTYCPWQPHDYVCFMQTASVVQRVNAVTDSGSWQLGGSIKQSIGFKTPVIEMSGSVSYGLSFTKGWSDVVAFTEQSSSQLGANYMLKSSANKCLVLGVQQRMATINGTQKAFIGVQGYVGVKQDAEWIWKSDGYANKIRQLWFPNVVTDALAAGMPTRFKFVDNEARMELPINLQFTLGSYGNIKAQSYPKESSICQDLKAEAQGVPCDVAAMQDEVFLAADQNELQVQPGNPLPERFVSELV